MSNSPTLIVNLKLWNQINDSLNQKDVEILDLQKHNKQVIEIFEDIMEVQGECDHWDHHGYCQTHNLHDKEDCPMYKIPKLLKELKK